MKIFKYSFIFLAFAVIVNVGLASAEITLEPYQYGLMGITTVSMNISKTTESVKKTIISTQSFEPDYVYTSYNDPCKDCKIIATLQKKVDGKWSDVTSTEVKMGVRGYFKGSLSESTGSYQISLKRKDFTLASTTFTWGWTVQPRSE